MNDNWIGEIHAHRFRKYSQTGEEGYIRFILDNIGYDNKYLVDIGAWDGFHLSNTRYFIEEHGFKSLLLDGDNHGNQEVKQEWITAENVCGVLKKYRCPQQFSLLNFDIDGNDYDILYAISQSYRPNLIVCEVNGTIPLGISKKIKYNPKHIWNNDDYYGFSMSAGLKLAEAMGYRIVFQNDALNLYMVRKDLINNTNLEIELNFQHCQYHRHNPNGLWEQV